MSEFKQSLARFWSSKSREDSKSTAGEVRRVLFDIDVEGRQETVVLSLHEGELRIATTDGLPDGPAVEAALSLFREHGETAHDAPTTGERRARRTSRDVREALRASRPEGHLGDTLADLVLAVARTGVHEAKESATVNEALAQFRDAYADEMPVHVQRWIGRLRWALAHRDVTLCARLLEGAARAAQDLREEHPDARQRERTMLWRGRRARGGIGQHRLTDRVFVEVGRELVSGQARSSIERRYLMCTRTGQVFSEVHARGSQRQSVGPCPRRLSVGLAEVEPGPQPRRVRLLQYAVSNHVGPTEWLEVSRRAARRFDALHDAYREAHRIYPGFAEPFFLIAPAEVHDLGGLVFADKEGRALPMAQARTPARAEFLRSVIAEGTVRWVSGRAVDADGSLMFDPCALGVERAGRMHFHRTT